MDQYLPDTFGGMTGAFNAGRLLKAQRQQAADQDQLRSLAPQVLNGDPAATAQAYAIDPAAAAQYGEGADRLGLQLHNIANQIKQMQDAGNEQGAAILYQQAAPMIRQKFPNAPAQYDPVALKPALDAVVALTEPTGGGGIHNAFQGANGNMWVLDKLGQPRDTGVPFDPRTQLRDQPGVAPGIVNLRTGNVAPLQQGGQPQPQAPGMAPGEVPFSIDPSLPADTQASIRANPAAYAAAPDGGQVNIAQPMDVSPPQAPPAANPAAMRPVDDKPSALQERLDTARSMGATKEQLDAIVMGGGQQNGGQYRTMTPAEVRAMGMPDGTVAQMSPSGQVQIVNKPRDLPAGGQVIDNGDGTTTYIPAGKLSDAQRNNAGFYDRMVNADHELTDLERKGYDPTNLRDYATVGGRVLNGLASDEGRQYHQAAQNWVRANLRKESGAAIGVKEMDDEIRNYFPVYGDDAGTIAQKAHNRQVVEQAMRTAAGAAIAPGGNAKPQQAAPGQGGWSIQKVGP